MFKLARILCPLDFSKTSRLALEAACDLARRYGAHVEILHVTGQKHRSDGVLLAPPEPKERDDHVALGKRLEAWSSEFELSAGAPIATLLRDGDPVEEIERVARENGHDLIVLGAAGRTGLKQALLGSVAERVTRHAPCPVLAVRPRPGRP